MGTLLVINIYIKTYYTVIIILMIIAIKRKHTRTICIAVV